MSGWNLFRYAGDICHLLSKIILLISMHRNRSAEGVSLITQILYAIVFCTRYLDVFNGQQATWNLCFKLFYILSSFYIVGVMRWLFPRTREKELAWKIGAAVFGGSLVMSPFVMLIFEHSDYWGFKIWLWDFSEILESVCVLPQLLLLRQTTVPTVIDSFYLLALGSYRGFYLLNWIQRAADPADRPPNAVSVIFGIVQVALYIDFAWVYYTRQRVKLRSGGIVDADDIRRGWLLNRIFGKALDRHDDEESAPALGGQAGGSRGGNGNEGGAGGRRSKWGARGISISADDTTLEHEERLDGDHNIDATVDPDAKMQDPDDLARALDDDDDDDDGTLPSSSGSGNGSGGKSAASGVRNDEWND